MPELKNMPLKFLFQPWKAPLKVQKSAGCIVGQEYPEPMVDHKRAAAECKQKMEEVKALLKDPSPCFCHIFSKSATILVVFFRQRREIPLPVLGRCVFTLKQKHCLSTELTWSIGFKVETYRTGLYVE